MFNFFRPAPAPAPKPYDCYITFIVEDQDLRIMFSQEAKALREEGFLGQETQVGSFTLFQLDFLHLQDAGWYIGMLDAEGVKWSMTIV
jgi:hypothetical protein